MATPNMFSLYLCAFIGFSIIGLSFTLRSPKIDFPRPEHTLESGDNYTIFCEGNAPLRWTFPKVDSKYKNYTLIHHNEASPRNSSYKFASELHITNITFPFVGFYNCHEQGRGRPSRIYLYVHDEYHLSVSELELETLLVTQRSDANIACRPTSPDVDVTLTTITNEQAENVTYDTKTGFKFFVNELSQSGEYICKFTRQKQEFETVYFVVVIITDSLAIPFISEQEKKLHNVVGDTIKLKCMIRTQVHTYVTWETPNGKMDERYTETSLSQEKNASDLYYKTLTINNATLQDRGIYWCKAKDNQNHTSEISINITIYDKDDHFIRLKEENDYEQITREAGTPSVQWNINIDALPEATVNWLNNRNEIIQAGITTKYETNITNTNAFLMIKDITISDFGNYTLVAENNFETAKLILFLNVTAKPSVEMTTEQEYQMLNDFRVVTCTVAAYPEPLIYWEYKPCLDNSCNYKELKVDSYDRKGLNWISNINQSFSQSGTIRCFANNSKGDDMKEMDLYISDVENGFDIYGLDEDVLYIKSKNKAIVAIGDSITVSCGAYVQNFSQTVKWMRDSEDIVSNDKYHIETSYTKFSNRTILTIKDMNIRDQGIYNCVLYNTDDDKKRAVKEKTIEFHVEESMAPTLNATNLNDTVEWNVGDKLELICDFEGLPKPSITWYKDNEIFWPHEVRTAVDDRNTKITFTYTKLQDEGTYRCEGRNSVGTKSKEMILSFRMNRYGTIWYILAIIVLLVMVFLASLIIYAKDTRKRKLEKVLKEAGLANFERGQLENLNPELGIDDQAELLPYDKKWEFPIHNLRMGKQLGAGAFGVVMKAEARGILADEEKTIVAVKMVKQNAEHTYVKALASELKIMVHLGKHLNVVNLLGACTKNVAKRELYVIVEYCRFGNLHNYLYRHRDNFINQVDPQTGHIDFNIGLDILERTYSIASSKSSSPMKYAAMSFRSNSTKSFNSENGRESDPCNTARTESTFVSMSPNTDQVTGDEGMILSNNSSSVQPEWRSNYRGDYKGTVRPIATKDLLAWAFQVARGMEYLASRKVLHGDLAARNILLADDNVVKICDFGLAKSMYKNDNYKKNSEGPLPIKWMAIESIRDRVFSTQSDVWSFGIVLWEFFSLARTPYPGMEAGERLYAKLVDGYRMEAPEFATNDIYRMMIDCWSSKPLSRPSFTKLAERIGYMLEDSVRKHYIDLNDPYLVMNTQRLQDGGSDYLAMVSPPNFENLSSPQPYVNEIQKSPGYMSMDTPGIFSPRTEEGTIFTFENKRKNGVSSKAEQVEDLPELAPMLGEVTPVCTSPTTPFSFSNPSYQMPPIIRDGCAKTDKNIVKSSDNYVNMPQNKSAVKEKTNSCAHIKLDEDTKDVHYVNSNSRDWETVIV